MGRNPEEVIDRSDSMAEGKPGANGFLHKSPSVFDSIANGQSSPKMSRNRGSKRAACAVCCRISESWAGEAIDAGVIDQHIRHRIAREMTAFDENSTGAALSQKVCRANCIFRCVDGDAS